MFSTSTYTSTHSTASNAKLPVAFVIFLSLSGAVSMMAIFACWFARRKSRREGEEAKKAKNARHSISEEEMLRRLESVSPKQIFREWWRTLREKLQVPDEMDNHIVCSICLDTINETDSIHGLDCYHVFHDKCLEQWFLASHLTCPLCQGQFYPSCDEVNCGGAGNIV